MVEFETEFFFIYHEESPVPSMNMSRKLVVGREMRSEGGSRVQYRGLFVQLPKDDSSWRLAYIILSYLIVGKLYRLGTTDTAVMYKTGYILYFYTVSPQLGVL